MHLIQEKCPEMIFLSTVTGFNSSQNQHNYSLFRISVMTTSNTRTLNAPQTNKPVIQVGSPTEVIDKGGLYTINDHDMSLNPDDVEVITLEQHGGRSEIKAFFGNLQLNNTLRNVISHKAIIIVAIRDCYHKIKQIT